MEYEFSTESARMQMDVIHGFLSGSYWSPGIRRDIVERAVQQSLVIGAFEQSTGRQVAFARVITDFATFAYLCDVFVLEPHRGRGVSKRMMEILLNDPRLQTLRRWCLATKDAHGLYRQFGFEEVSAGRWMERKSAAEVWQNAV